MAKYTIELKSLMDNSEVMNKIQNALKSYPLYTSEAKNEMIASLIPTREELNRKLLNHYKYYEIGFETIGRFIDELEITMNEIMPYYNQLYKSVEIMTVIEDPFGNVDVTETIEEERTNTSNSEDVSEVNSNAKDSSSTLSSVESNSKNVESETPQGNIVGISASNIDTISHADKINWTKNSSDDSASTEGESESNVNSTSTGNRTSTDKFKHTFTKKGNQGVNTYAHDMEELRKTYIDVTDRIIKDKRIKELFMLIY